MLEIGKYVLLIPQFSIKIININFMRKIDLYCFRRDEVEKMPNALIVLPPQTSFVQFFFEQLYKKASRQTHIAQGEDFVMRKEFCKFFDKIMECTS